MNSKVTSSGARRTGSVSRGTKYSIPFFEKIAKKKGGRCLSKTYRGALSPLQFECRRGHVFRTRASRVVSGTWCRQCVVEESRLGLDSIKRIARSRQGWCLSDEYKNARTPLLFRCRKKHEWYATADNVKNKESWCPYCAGVAVA